MQFKNLTPNAYQHLIQAFMSLSGVGEQGAQRMLYSCLQEDKGQPLLEALEQAQKLRLCVLCRAYSESDTCPVCMDKKRDNQPLAVVLNMQDRATLLNDKQYSGHLFVLSKLLMPSAGLGLTETGMAALLERIKSLEINRLYAFFPVSSAGNLSLQFLMDVLQDKVQVVHIKELDLWHKEQKNTKENAV